MLMRIERLTPDEQNAQADGIWLFWSHVDSTEAARAMRTEGDNHPGVKFRLRLVRRAAVC